VAVTALAMEAALAFPMGVVTEIEEGSEARRGDNINIPALTAVAAVGTAPRNVFFATETAAAVAAVAAGNANSCAVNKHGAVKAR